MVAIQNPEELRRAYKLLRAYRRVPESVLCESVGNNVSVSLKRAVRFYTRAGGDPDLIRVKTDADSYVEKMWIRADARYHKGTVFCFARDWLWIPEWEKNRGTSLWLKLFKVGDRWVVYHCARKPEGCA